MLALLNDHAFIKHGDFIAEFAGAEAVADIDRRSVAGYFVEFFVCLRFGYRFLCRGRFINDNKQRILYKDIKFRQ